MQVSLIYALTYVASMFFPALSAVFKERIFKEAKEKLDGKDLDLFAGTETKTPQVLDLLRNCLLNVFMTERTTLGLQLPVSIYKI